MVSIAICFGVCRLLVCRISRSSDQILCVQVKVDGAWANNIDCARSFLIVERALDVVLIRIISELLKRGFFASDLPLFDRKLLDYDLVSVGTHEHGEPVDRALIYKL